MKSLLEHPTRRAILELARAEPGIHFSEILNRLSTASGHPPLGHGSLSYHLYKLERAGLVASRRSGRHRRYYDAKGVLGAFTALSIVQRAGVLDLAKPLCEVGPASATALVLFTKKPVSRQTVAYRIRLMESGGLVARERVGREIQIVATSRLRQAISMLGARLPADPSFRSCQPLVGGKL